MRLSRLSLLFAGFLPAAAYAVDIDSCGQTVAGNQVATLVADLNCPTDAPAITLEASSRLEMAGHSITGGSYGIHGSGAGRRTVRGPGSISGSPTAGIGSVALSPDDRIRLNVSDVDVSGTGDGIVADGRLSLERVTVDTCTGVGLRGQKVKGKVVDVLECAVGVHGDRTVDLRTATVSDNSGNGVEIDSGLIRIRASMINDNGGFGLKGSGNYPANPGDRGRVMLTESTATGNGLVDVLSVSEPVVRNSSCDRSERALTAGYPWGKCSLDNGG